MKSELLEKFFISNFHSRHLEHTKMKNMICLEHIQRGFIGLPHTFCLHSAMQIDVKVDWRGYFISLSRLLKTTMTTDEKAQFTHSSSSTPEWEKIYILSCIIKPWALQSLNSVCTQNNIFRRDILRSIFILIPRNFLPPPGALIENHNGTILNKIVTKPLKWNAERISKSTAIRINVEIIIILFWLLSKITVLLSFDTQS